MIRPIAGAVFAAVLTVSGCQPLGSESAVDVTPTPTPGMKGDPGGAPQSYPTEMAPNPRTNGQWMVAGIIDEPDGSHSVACWIDSNAETMRWVVITPAEYEEFMANQDTGSIPCPEVPR